jgi:hypothetical protein
MIDEFSNLISSNSQEDEIITLYDWLTSFLI